MQVSFTGILKAYLSSENSVQNPIEKKFLKAKRVEDVFNRQDGFRTYTESEQMKMLFSAKKAIKDYKEPNTSMGEDYMKEAGMYRLTARDAIYYCTGSDIEPAKKLHREIKEKGLNKEERQRAISEFIDERTKNGSNSGFVIMDSSDGRRYDLFGFGEAREKYPFTADFLEL